MHRVVFLLAVAAAAIFAGSAAATPPVMTPFTDTVNGTMSGVCSFDVGVSANVTGTEIDYFDQSGTLTRFRQHITEQDTFSANGKSLTGMPFTFNVNVLLDADGNYVHVYVDGVAEKVVLPDGTLFVSAGQIDWMQHLDEGYVLSPEKGHTGNVAAFCAALS